MTGFKYQGTDLDDLIEPKGTFNSPNPDFKGYSTFGESMEGRYAAYNGKGWEKLFSSTYLYNGTPIQACSKGYKPSVLSRFFSINGQAGQGNRTVYISRSESALTFSGDVSISFGPSSFRNNKVPMVIGIILCAGGGGRGYQDTDKNDNPKSPFYGGGGGAIGWFVINLSQSYRLVLGKGGGAYENGGNSYLYTGDTMILYVDSGGYHPEGTGGDLSPRGTVMSVSNPNSNVFAVNGEMLTNSNRSYVGGCPGFSELANGRTVEALARVAFDSSDPLTDFGTPSTVVPSNDGQGGGSLNGSMVGESSNGTNGAGCGALASSGGGGAAFFFY